MIEIFKTNVKEKEHATMLVQHIHKLCAGHEANFDLQDIDNILRVKSTTGVIELTNVLALLKEHGFSAEVLKG